MPLDFSERAWHWFFEKDDDYTENPMREDQDLVMGSRSSPATFYRAKENLTPGANPNIDRLLEVEDDKDGQHFDGFIGGESARQVVVIRQLHDLQH